MAFCNSAHLSILSGSHLYMYLYLCLGLVCVYTNKFIGLQEAYKTSLMEGLSGAGMRFRGFISVHLSICECECELCLRFTAFGKRLLKAVLTAGATD